MRLTNHARDRFIRELDDWLTPDLLYHCFTGEGDANRLARVVSLDHVLQSALLEKVERQWPERLQSIAAERRAEWLRSKAITSAYVTQCLKSSSTSPMLNWRS